MERILVLTDFSDIATKGLETAVHLARQMGGAEILLLNTERSTSGPEFSATADVTEKYDAEESRFMIELIRRNKQRLQEQAVAYAVEKVPIVTFMEIGDMQKVVDTFLHERKVDMLVMGTSGKSSGEEYFVGNHTEQVLRVSNVPVLSVKLNDPVRDFRHMVVATDMNHKADRSMEHIKRLAARLGAKLHLVHVSSKPEKYQPRLEEYAQNHGFENYTVGVVDDKDTEEGITRYSEKVGADMIALVTHGRDGIAAFFTHSTSEGVIRKARLPVLTLNMKEIK